MSIDWKKPIRIIDLTDLEVIYLQQLDNVSEPMHLIKVNEQMIAIYGDGVLPGEDRPWVENIPEDKWQIVAIAKETFSSLQEAEDAVDEFRNKSQWNIKCEKVQKYIK